MSEAPVYQEILYLDDFVHRNSNNVHWDHVKFNHAVYLEQIRIIPRCCSVGLKNGQKHLGQTSPSKFKLEFYANNLNRSDDRATLDKIGSLVYDDEISKPSPSSYILEPSSVPIDWLVIVGSYSCLSLAIVGVKAKAATTSTTTTTETATTTTTTTTTTTSMFPIDQPPPPLPPHLFMHPPPPINPAGFINTPPPQFSTTIPPPPLLPNPTNPSLIALNQNSSHQNGLLLRTGGSSNQQQQQQQPGRTYGGSNQRYHPYMMSQQQKYNASYNNHFLNRQYPNPRMMSPHFMMMQANSGGTNENEMMDDEEGRSIDEDEFEEMMENGEDELNGEMEDGDEEDFDEEEEREDENDEDSGESALVKWYLNLDENQIESSETERVITDIGAVKADNDVLDQYLTHQLSQFNTNRKSASIVNPCLNDYELYLAKKRLQQEAANSSEQTDEKIDSFVSQFEKLFGEKPKTPPPTTETAAEPTTEPTTTVAAVEEKDLNQSQVDYLDELVSRLKTESYSYSLFDRLPRDKLESIVTTHLIAPEHYTDKKRFNVGVKLANLLLVRFDRGDETRSREWMQKLAKRLLSLCTASDCVVQTTKLKCLSCLYDLIGTRQGCEAFVDGNHYSKMLELFSPSKTLTSRMSVALSAILAKVTFCDSLSKFSTSCESKFNYSVVRLPTKREEEIAAKKSGSEEEVSSIEQDLNTITSYIKRTLEADMTTTSTESTGVIWRAARDKRGGKERRRRRAAEGQPSMEEVYDEEEGRFNQMPVRTIFDDLMRLRTASSRHRPKLAALNALLRFMHEFDFFTHLLTFSASASSRLASIEWIINEVLLPSELNNYSLAGIEYLLSNSSLSRCLDEVFSAKIKSARLIVTAANVLSSLVSLGRTLDTIRSSSQDTNTEILRATSLIQSINFEVVSSLSLSTKWFRLIDLLLLPDGGFSNSYARVLPDWLEFVIYDRNFTSPTQKTDNSMQFARLYIINSLTHILHTACKTNTRWSSSQCVDGSTLMRLNKLVSTLINYMIITKLRPDLAHNRSYFELIDRLKAIKSHLEPFAFRSSNSKSSHDFASLNLCIDSFRDSIDRNLSLFFSKTHLNTTVKQRQKLTYLNGNITQMRVIKRLLEPITMRSNRFMTQKLILGHLISRNVLHILLNYLTRINDYMMFYLYIKSIPCDISTVDALLDLIEPSLYILKVYLANLTEPNRMASTTLPILFKFYALISHSLIKKEEKSEKGEKAAEKGDKTDKSLMKKTIKQWYANRVVARLQSSVSTRSRLVTTYLNEIFLSFTNRSVLIDELAKFALDTPFYMNHGLVLMASLLKAMSHSHFGKYLNEPLKDKNSSLSRLLCHVYQISQASRASTTARQIFARLSRESSINESLCAIMMRLLYERFDDMRTRLGVKDQEIKIEKRRRSGAGLKRHHEEIEAISDDEEDEHEADENADDVNDDSDDADDYDDEKRMGDNDEDYSIYDTKTIWNSSSGGDKAAAANTSTSNNTDSSASILGEDMLLQKSLNDSLSSIAAEAKESAIKFAEMTRSVQEFAKVVRFVADLVAMSSRFRAEFGLHLKLNPNNEDETYIKADSYKYILIDMIKYFKQIDMSNSDMSSDSSSEEKPKRQLLTRVQEAIAEFVDTSCRYNFLDLKCMQLVRFVVQSFVANVNSSLKPSWPNSADLRARLLTTLVLIIDRIITNDVDVRRLDFLSLVASLSNEIKSAGASLSGRVADSVNMLLIVIVEILARAINSGRFERYKAFKESRLKWTTASKMTNEMLIDSIATQSLTESSAAASSLHPLIALDKILDESPIGSSRKWKLAQSQLKSLVKLLNEFEPEDGEMLPLATNNSEVELIYKLKKSRDGLVEETNVYNDEDDDMSIDDITTNPATNAEIITWCKSSKESILISDSSLYTKLVAAIEENERIHQQHVQQQRQLNLIQQQQKQQLIEGVNQQPAAKAKTEVINTRTGIAFKAPMRGGHVNQANRAAANTQQNNINQSNIPRVDSFRTRTPNTSRPPSLHVDDYVRLEKQQQQQQQQSTTTVNETSNKPTETVNTNQKEQPQMIKSNSFSGNPPAVTTTIPATTSSLEISSLSTTMSTPSLQSSSNATSNLQVHSQSYPKLSSPNQVTSPSQPNLSLTTAPSSTSPPPQQQQTTSNPNNNNNNNPNIDTTPNIVNVNPSINKNSSLNSPLPKSISSSNFNSCGIDIHDLQQSTLPQQQSQQKQQQRFNTNFNNSQVFQSPQQQQQGNFPTQQLMSPNEGQFNYMLGPPPPSQSFQQPPPFHPHMPPNLVGGPSNQFQMPPPSVPLQQHTRFPLNPQFRPPFDVRRLGNNSNNKNSGGNQNNSGNNNQNYRGQYQ